MSTMRSVISDLSGTISTLEEVKNDLDNMTDIWEEVIDEFGSDDKDDIIAALSFAKEVQENTSDDADAINDAWELVEQFKQKDIDPDEALSFFGEFADTLKEYHIDRAAMLEKRLIGAEGWDMICETLGVSVESQREALKNMIVGLEQRACMSADDQKALILGRAVLAALRAGAAIPVVEAPSAPAEAH